MSNVTSLKDRQDRIKKEKDDLRNRFQVFLGCFRDTPEIIMRLIVKAPLGGGYGIGIYADDHSQILSIKPEVELSDIKSTALIIVLKKPINYHVIDFLPDTNTVQCTLYFDVLKDGDLGKEQALHTGCHIC